MKYLVVAILILAAHSAQALRLPGLLHWLAEAPTPLLSPKSRVVPNIAARAGTAAAVETVFNVHALQAVRTSAAARAQQQQPQHQQHRQQHTQPVKITPRDDAGAFDPDLARLLAQLQSVAYCPNLAAVREWDCARCAAVPGFITHEAHYDDAWDLSGYAGYLPLLGAKVLVFRGTDSSSWSNCECLKE